MTETSVKNEVCRHCGADVRPNSQFCYSCGGALAAETAANTKDSPKIVESNNGDLSKQTTELKLAEPSAAPLSKPEIQEDGQLKSAASMRRKPKIYQPKQVEIIWEEPENAPNLWFILAAVVLTLFAAAVFYLAIYLK